MHLDETWILPHKQTLCVIRYIDEHHEGARKEQQVHEEEQEKCMEEGVQQLKARSGSLDTRCS